MSASDYKPIPSSELPVDFKDLTVVPLEEVAKSEYVKIVQIIILFQFRIYIS